MSDGFGKPAADGLGRTGDDCDASALAATSQGLAVQRDAHSNSMPVLREPFVSCTRRAGVRVRLVPGGPNEDGSMSDFPLKSVRLISSN